MDSYYSLRDMINQNKLEPKCQKHLSSNSDE